MKISTWIYKIAYHTALTVSYKKENNIYTLNINELPVKGYETNFAEQEETTYLVKTALQYLKPNERALVNLFYLKELNLKEIRDITNLSKSAIKVGLFRSRKKLKETIEVLIKNNLK